MLVISHITQVCHVPDTETDPEWSTLLLLGMRSLLVHGMPGRLVKIIGLSAPDGGLRI
jgi:hypothetical protein